MSDNRSLKDVILQRLDELEKIAGQSSRAIINLRSSLDNLSERFDRLAKPKPKDEDSWLNEPVSKATNTNGSREAWRNNPRRLFTKADKEAVFEMYHSIRKHDKDGKLTTYVIAKQISKVLKRAPTSVYGVLRRLGAPMDGDPKLQTILAQARKVQHGEARSADSNLRI